MQSTLINGSKVEQLSKEKADEMVASGLAKYHSCNCYIATKVVEPKSEPEPEPKVEPPEEEDQTSKEYETKVMTAEKPAPRRKRGRQNYSPRS